MARRLFNGRAFSEDGWPYVDAGSCTWTIVPGTNVSLQIQNGPPLAIMRAVAADFNAYVEPLRDPDSACWTPGNSVATSNHPGGTAMDLNWNTHAFQAVNTFNPAQRATIKEIVDFYEGMIGWAGPGYWSGGPVDEMHWQMGYGTYDQANDRPFPKVQDFINRKIRADGFSTFRRGGTITPPPAPPATSGAADVLARATGVTPAKAAEIILGVVNGLRDSECTNVNRIAMWLAQMGHESAGFNATEEYASGAAYEGRRDLGNTQPGDGVRFKGRTWIQITGRSNYTALSKWAFSKGIIPTPTFFVDDSTKLAEMQYAGLGPAWYWTVARADINALSDKRDLVSVTQRINGGQNGIADRRTRYDRALALGNDLLALTTPTDSGDDFMSALSADEQREVLDLLRWIAAPDTGELRKKFASRSAVREPNEGTVDTTVGMGLNTDGNVDLLATYLRAKLKYPPALARLQRVAAGTEAGRNSDDALLAQAMLADVAALQSGTVAPSVPLQAAAEPSYAQVSAPSVVYLPADAGPATPQGSSTGAVLGRAFDALEALKSAQVALSPEAQASIDSLINVLKPGSAA